MRQLIYAIAISWVGAEILAWLTPVAKLLAKLSARLLRPEHRARYQEEWERHIQDLGERRLSGLLWAIHCPLAALRLKIAYRNLPRATRPRQAIAGAADTPTGMGHWLVTRTGGVLPRGDAAYFGSLEQVALSSRIVAIVPTPTGHGYWLAAQDGGIFAFGDAKFLGSIGSRRLRRRERIVTMEVTPTGDGYWLTDKRGRRHSFGDVHLWET